VYKVNPRERLHNKGEWFEVEVEEIYQEDELPTNFNIGTEVLPESFVADSKDVVSPKKGNRSQRRKHQIEGNNLILISNTTEKSLCIYYSFQYIMFIYFMFIYIMVIY
jgi:hypothetical protein